MSNTTSRHPVQRGQQYKRAILGVFTVAVVGLAVGIALNRQLAGLVVYAAGCLTGVAGTLYLEHFSPVELYDERGRRHAERASNAVVNLFAYVGLPAFIGLFLADATGVYELGATATGALYAFSAFYLVWGAVYALVRSRS